MGAVGARFATRSLVASCAVTVLAGLPGAHAVSPGARSSGSQAVTGRSAGASASRLTETGAGLNNVVACPAAHACLEGGTVPVKRWYQADLVRQTGGGWATPKVLDGITSLSRVGASGVTGLACPAVGECVAVGYYDRGATTARGAPILLAFAAVESGGSWSPARELPGLGVLAPSRDATVGAVSCGGVGECAIVGSFRTARGTTTAYGLTEQAGTWGAAAALPDLAGGPGSAATSASCPSPGECTAAGWMVGAGGRADAFTSVASSGTWGPATVLPGMATISTTGAATANAVSCGAPGQCAVTGTVDETRSGGLAFVDAEVDGTWGAAIDVPGLAQRTHAHAEDGLAVSCEPSGTCVAGGYYRRDTGPVVAFLDVATGGAWHVASDVLGPDLRVGSSAAVTSLACDDAEDCAGAGTFRARGGGWRTFVVDEVAGAWGDAVPLSAPKTPGDADDAWIGQVACLPGTLQCAAAGYFQPARGRFTATATAFTPAGPSITSISPETGPPRGGEVVVVHGTNLAGATSVRVGGVGLELRRAEPADDPLRGPDGARRRAGRRHDAARKLRRIGTRRVPGGAAGHLGHARLGRRGRRHPSRRARDRPRRHDRRALRDAPRARRRRAHARCGPRRRPARARRGSGVGDDAGGHLAAVAAALLVPRASSPSALTYASSGRRHGSRPVTDEPRAGRPAGALVPAARHQPDPDVADDDVRPVDGGLAPPPRPRGAHGERCRLGLACVATVAYGYVARERRLTTGVWTSAAIGTTVLFGWSWAAILVTTLIASIVAAVTTGPGGAFAGLFGVVFFGALVSLALAVVGFAVLVVLLTCGAVLASTVRWLGRGH